MPPESLTVKDNGEMVVIVGAGAAGIAASIAAARQGKNVLLVEKTNRLGGTVTQSLIHTIGGLYDSSGNPLNNGLPMELADRLLATSPLTCKRKIGKTWVLNVSPAVYGQVVENWLAGQKQLHVMREAAVCEISVDNGTVQTVKLETNQESMSIRTATLVDATGNCEVVRLVDPSLVTDDSDKAAAGLIFTMRGCDADVLKFPKGIDLLRKIHKAAEVGDLPEDCKMAWLDRGIFKDEVYIKLFLPLESDWRTSQARNAAELHAHSMRDAMVEFLVKLPAFAGARLMQTGDLGIRDGGRVKGEYCLTADDVRACRRFTDAIGRCCWPIEYWDSRKGIMLEYLPANNYYEIPLRSLKVKGFANMWVAGKCLSAEPWAQASARVAGTCWCMGEAVGMAISVKV